MDLTKEIKPITFEKAEEDLPSQERGDKFPRTPTLPKDLSDMRSMSFGRGASGIRIDEQGVWFGSDLIKDAKFGITSEGKLFGSDLKSQVQTKESDGSVVIGDSKNNLTINGSGESQFNGRATVWNDLRIEPVARTTGTNAPSFAAWKTVLRLYSFDNAVGGSEKEIYFNVQLPHDWKEGSTMYPHLHWVPVSAGSATDTVYWKFEYSKARINSQFSGVVTQYGTELMGGGNLSKADTHVITSLGEIDMEGDLISTIIVCKLTRMSADAKDTYSGTAGLLYLDIHYEIDSIGGSQEEYIKES